MKNVSLLLNLLLIALVAILFGMYFSLRGKLKGELQGSAPVTNSAGGGSGKSLSIACINDDTIGAKYLIMHKLSQEIQQRQQELQDEYETKGRKLQEEYAGYQQKAQSGNISQIDAQRIQKDLQEKKNELDNIQQQQEELVKEAQDKNQQLSEKVIDFVNRYNKTRHFDYIFTYSATHGPIIVSNPMLDITNEIVDGLNKESADSLSKSPATH